MGERDDTTCRLCTLGDIGDEFHYVLKCEFFRADRRRYLGKEIFNNPNIHTFRRVMNIANPRKLRDVTKFIAIILNKCSTTRSLDNPVEPVYVPVRATRSGRCVREPIRYTI